MWHKVYYITVWKGLLLDPTPLKRLKTSNGARDVLSIPGLKRNTVINIFREWIKRESPSKNKNLFYELVPFIYDFAQQKTSLR